MEGSQGYGDSGGCGKGNSVDKSNDESHKAKKEIGNEIGKGVELKEKKFCDSGIRSEWCCTKEASRILSITENAIRIMVYRGQLPVYKFGRRLRFRYIDLESLFQKRRF